MKQTLGKAAVVAFGMSLLLTSSPFSFAQKRPQVKRVNAANASPFISPAAKIRVNFKDAVASETSALKKAKAAKKQELSRPKSVAR